jgi:lysophospholipase L1-like esterase
VRISIRAFEHLAVSIYVPGPTGPVTQHGQAHQTSFATAPNAGNRGGQQDAAGFAPAGTARPFVTGLDVRGPRRDGVVAAIGDSITDGDQRSAMLQELGVDEDARYPDLLARRLASRRFSVLNLGIGGNRVLADLLSIAGPSLLHRLGPDLLGRTDVTDVILTEGINDLGFDQALPADAVIDGLRRAVRRLHVLRRDRARPRLHVLVGTLTPSFGAAEAGHATAATEQRRQEINAVIRAGGIGDGIVDFDRALRDPADPSRLAPAFNGGDGLHPSSAGYRRMARAVDLAKLAGPAC